MGKGSSVVKVEHLQCGVIPGAHVNIGGEDVKVVGVSECAGGKGFYMRVSPPFKAEHKSAPCNLRTKVLPCKKAQMKKIGSIAKGASVVKVNHLQCGVEVGASRDIAGEHVTVVDVSRCTGGYFIRVTPAFQHDHKLAKCSLKRKKQTPATTPTPSAKPRLKCNKSKKKSGPITCSYE